MVSVQRHLAQLRGALEPGEQERLWIRSERLPQGEAGALLLTDRRLRFVGMGFVQQAELAWPLAEVRDVVVDAVALRCTAGGASERFAGRAKDLQRLAAALGSPRQPRGPLVGELERLAALHASDALTDEEFAAAKARLLG